MSEPEGAANVASRLMRWRCRLSHLIYPYWTQTEIDAARWRGHQMWLETGFGVKHGVDEPCPAHAKAREHDEWCVDRHDESGNCLNVYLPQPKASERSDDAASTD